MAYKYQRLYDELKKMAQGLPANAQFPSVRNLMEAYHMSQGTVEKAIRALRGERMLATVGNEGYYVLPQRERAKAARHLKICFAQSDYPSSLFEMIEETFRNFFTGKGHEFIAVRYPWSKGLSSMLKPGLMDAFLCVPAVPELSTREINFLKALDIHAIVLSTDASSHGIDSIFADAELGGMLAAEHLLKLGHRKLAYLHGEPDSPLSSGKFNGVRRQCLLAGLAEPERLDTATQKGELSTRKAYAAIKERLKTGSSHFTGLVADSDSCAIGAIRAFHEEGMAVPNDVSVASFNNVPEAEFFVPSITSVDYNHQAWAEAANDLILASPEGSAVQKIIAPRLVARESSGPITR